MQVTLCGQTRLGSGGSSGATRSKKTKAILKEWVMPNDYGIADSVVVDTASQNYPMRNVLNDRSIAWAYNGNLISPTQSKVYFDRSGNGMLSLSGTRGEYWKNGLGNNSGIRQKTDLLFGSAYEPYILTARDVPFHRTTIAYSDIAYKKGFTTYHEENDLSFSFTGNLSPRTNLGTKITYLNSPGHYTSQEGKVVNGCVYGSYDGNHYGLHAAFGFNVLSNFENGGLQDVSLLGGSLASEDLPVNLHAMSGFKHIFGYIDHHYSITVEREEKRTIHGRRGEEDRDTTVTVHIPVITFNHVFEVNNSTKRYVEKTAEQSFYTNTYLNPATTSDTANVLNIRNTLAVTFNEEFNRLLHFGATAYATNEFQRYIFGIGQRDTLLPVGIGQVDEALIASYTAHLMPDTLYGKRWVNNTWVGGSIYKNRGKWVRFGVNGDVCLAGYKLGEFQVNGHVDGSFPIGQDSLIIRATAYVKNETPTYYTQHYRSNHYLWDNNFSKTYRFYVGGEVAYPSQWFKAKAKIGFENLTNYIYFAGDGTPMQYNGNIQVIAGELRFDVTTPWLNFENTAVIQHSSSRFVPLPLVAVYSNLYYHGWWFKRAMYAQIGTNVRYHTAYHAPLLNPAIGQFCIQQDTKVGNYPILNLYANFYVKLLKLKFFAEWQHFNWYFMKNTHSYLSMPGYATNPSIFRAGLAWHFWR
ncbi:MAG: putative porin [Paludibacteraceae bacterium]|nr:putative porin [Paludibacteraceae bacterium]